ncbi:TetR/AcrR family transcriptional regulator [Arhodomonas sp. AD133]|uniref:TetR/AcrR family transcriptional regulator n=1 Tax=Arhodomonas sp. AD133 TaxID=3415009 RepID=UPI003EBDCB17
MSRRRRGETRREILNTAERLLQARGFHGFSYHHISEKLGVRNAAVHYHFPTKADLGAAVARRFREDFAWWRRQLESRGLDGGARLEAYFDLDGRYASERKVCPLGVVGVEFGGLPPEMCREAGALQEDVFAFLVDTLGDGRADGSMRFDGDVEDVARQVLAATQGGLQLARVQGESAYYSVLKGLRSTLGMRELESARRLAG